MGSAPVPYAGSGAVSGAAQDGRLRRLRAVLFGSREPKNGVADLERYS
jgi:hypothetical protein